MNGSWLRRLWRLSTGRFGVIVALVILGVLLLLGIRWLIRHRLPPADVPLAFGAYDPMAKPVYAEKQRWLYLPPGTKLRYTAEGPLDFPIGAALVKTFAYPADLRRPDEAVRRLETRRTVTSTRASSPTRRSATRACGWRRRAAWWG